MILGSIRYFFLIYLPITLNVNLAGRLVEFFEISLFSLSSHSISLSRFGFVISPRILIQIKLFFILSICLGVFDNVSLIHLVSLF